MESRSSESYEGHTSTRAVAGEMEPMLERGSLFDPTRIAGRARQENFPVASFLLPGRWRSHLMAVYAFARLVDDMGDEACGDRPALLDDLEADLSRALAGDAVIPQVQAVGRSIAALDLPIGPFHDLIEANRQDQVVTRYQDYDELVAYCRLSAVPVGRIVLAVMGEAHGQNLTLSDDVCIGLQLVEHLQDVAEDYRRGRVYLPMEDLHACGCSVDDLGAPSAAAPVRRTVALVAGRAHTLLASGRTLAHRLPPRARLAVAGYAAGGLAALDSIAAHDYDVLANRCGPGHIRLAARALSIAGGPLWKAP